MTILEAAHDMCRAVIKSPARGQLQSLIYALNHAYATPPPGHVDRSVFGYFARQQRVQFLGYLLVDQERTRLASAPMPQLIPRLADDERTLLLSAHSQLVALHRSALEPLLTKYPSVDKATDPYGRKLALHATLDHSNPPFPTQEVDKVALAFRSHPALKLALASPPELLHGVTSDRPFVSVENFERWVRSEGPGRASGQLSDFINNEPVTSPARASFRLLASIMSLRASLGVLTQMIFQAVRADKPPILDQSNLADWRHLGTSYTGEGVRLVFQPGPGTFEVEAGDVLLLKRVPNMAAIEGLLTADAVSSHYGESGFTMTVAGRIVSDSLDPYSGFAGRF